MPWSRLQYMNEGGEETRAWLARAPPSPAACTAARSSESVRTATPAPSGRHSRGTEDPQIPPAPRLAASGRRVPCALAALHARSCSPAPFFAIRAVLNIHRRVYMGNPSHFTMLQRLSWEKYWNDGGSTRRIACSPKKSPLVSGPRYLPGCISSLELRFRPW